MQIGWMKFTVLPMLMSKGHQLCHTPCMGDGRNVSDLALGLKQIIAQGSPSPLSLRHPHSTQSILTVASSPQEPVMAPCCPKTSPEPGSAVCLGLHSLLPLLMICIRCCCGEFSLRFTVNLQASFLRPAPLRRPSGRELPS